ncbi:hypothetical protein [Streptomyces beihaiensis]|uniref:Secreted protein n=1 Tax=Streptomyces beihaiensis TaxID=2984495 RepID=A0ABT3U549_9ACTN|nr:hypothetical protein [Streptomyces beihaiensis]MCX3064200.1 hypothetical protein [Streptomyces beihaiensis]
MSNVMLVAAIVAVPSPLAESATLYPHHAKSPTAQVREVVQAAENVLSAVVSSPAVHAHRQPVPADRDSREIAPAMTDPVLPDGMDVVGCASPPVISRTNMVIRRGPTLDPKVPPPPEKLPASVQPDGVDGTLSVGCPEATSRMPSCPAVGVAE